MGYKSVCQWWLRKGYVNRVNNMVMSVSLKRVRHNGLENGTPKWARKRYSKMGSREAFVNKCSKDGYVNVGYNNLYINVDYK